MTKRMFACAFVLLLLFGGWAVCWPRVMRFVTAHKTRNIPTKMYDGKFADMNPVQLGAAQRYGISPIDDRNFDFDGCPQLTEIKSCNAYSLDKLTHSVPYLTPAAAELLKEIGEDFQTRLEEAGLAKRRIVVTSVLRTKEDVQRLATVNVNASENSAHCYVRFERQQHCFHITLGIH